MKLNHPAASMRGLTGLLIWGLCLISTFGFSQKLNVNGTATVKLSNVGTNRDIPVSVEILHSFPAYGYHGAQDTLTSTSRTISLTFPIHSVQQVFVSIDNQRLTLLMRPFDTVDIFFDGSKPTITYQIEGKNKQIQSYYQAKAAQFPVSAGQQVMNAGVGDVDLDEFTAFADSLYALEKAFLDKNARNLPSWFIRYETDAISYTDAFLRFYTYQYRQAVKKQAVNAPEHYFDFLKTIPIRNTAALYNDAYLSFLREYVRYHTANVSTPSQTSILTQYHNNIKLLGQEVGEFFTIFTISEALNDNPAQVRKDLAGLPTLKTHASLIPYLQKSATQRVNVLSPGKSSPDFILPDTRDSLVSLSQLKGQVVYLSFWFAGCKGCIEEFPYENGLVARFEGKPFKIVSICTRTSRAMWLQKVSQYGLKTLNLYANPQRGSALEEKFGINVYPQYVLIGPDGKIIENFTSRPSDGAYDKIMKVLAAGKP